jgi:hypothetical protein
MIGMLGCAHEPDMLPITPDYPTLGSSRRTRPWISSLVVATETWIDLNLASVDDGTVSRPTGYTLYDEQGFKIMYVRNYIGSTDTEPTTLDLEPGHISSVRTTVEAAARLWVVSSPAGTEVNLGSSFIGRNPAPPVFTIPCHFPHQQLMRSL